MEQELVRSIQKNWRCFVRSAKKIRKAWLFDTNRGPLFVKAYSSMERAQWLVSLSGQLKDRGFNNTLEYIYTAGGDPFMDFGDKYYVAMRPISGRDARYDNLYDVIRTIGCLGEFHRSAVGIEGAPGGDGTYCPVIDKWEERILRFSNIVHHLKTSKKKGGMDNRIIRFSPYILQEAQTALHVARRSPLLEEYSRALMEKRIAHRDLASHNFLIGEQTWLIDYDTSMYDTPLTDLIQMVGRIMDQQTWNLDVFSLIMDEYRKKMPLSEQQAALTYILLRYPDNFMREVIGLYEGRSGFVSKKIDAYLTSIMKQWKFREQFFQGSIHFLDLPPGEWVL